MSGMQHALCPQVFVFNFGYAKEVHRVSPAQVEEQQQPEVAATVEAENLKETDVEAPQL